MSAIAMQQMAEKVNEMLPEDFGFAILVFPFGNNKEANFISSARREDIIKVFRETADRLEKGLDYETPEDNIYS